MDAADLGTTHARISASSASAAAAAAETTTRRQQQIKESGIESATETECERQE